MKTKADLIQDVCTLNMEVEQLKSQQSAPAGWRDEILTELRKALGTDGTVYRNVKAMLAAAPKADVQEPIGYVRRNHIGAAQIICISDLIYRTASDDPAKYVPLYAAPQPSDDVTKALAGALEDAVADYDAWMKDVDVTPNESLLAWVTKAKEALAAYRAAMGSK